MNEEQSHDLATQYVLGQLTGDARVSFERALQSDPALRAEVAALEDGVYVLAQSVPMHAPPPDLRATLLEKFSAPSAAAASPVVPFTRPDPAARAAAAISSAESGDEDVARPDAPDATPRRGVILTFIPWAAAAAAAVFGWQQWAALREVSREQADLNAAVESATRRTDDLLAQNTRLTTTRTTLEEALKSAQARLDALESENSTLVADVARLRDAGHLDKARIAVLGSLLKNDPKAVAVTLWDQKEQNGLLVVENLPALPAGKDYQLWVIDPDLGAPVSAGVFKVDKAGKMRLIFKPDKPIGTADKFAVTVEKEGGVASPTMDKMVVIGG